MEVVNRLICTCCTLSEKRHIRLPSSCCVQVRELEHFWLMKFWTMLVDVASDWLIPIPHSPASAVDSAAASARCTIDDSCSMVHVSRALPRFSHVTATLEQWSAVTLQFMDWSTFTVLVHVLDICW